MQGIINLGIELWFPQNVIIDIKKLSYKWGNRIDEVLYQNNDYIKIAIILGESNKKGITSLIHGNSDINIIDNDYYFDSIEDALEKLNQQT